MAKITHYERSYEPVKNIPPMVVATDICCNAKGIFYCVIPDCILEFFTTGNKFYGNSVCVGLFKDNKDRWCFGSRDLKELESKLHEAAEAMIHIDEVIEPVIAYEIISKGHFAYDSEGNIFPNLSNKSDNRLQWTNDSIFDSGARDSWRKHLGSAFAVEVAAKVYSKITRTVGPNSAVQYEIMRPENTDCMQYKLNAWQCVPDLDKAKFIPYSDKAALFFYEMIEAIACLNKRLQDATFEQEHLLKAIESGRLFLPNATSNKNDKA